MEQYNDLTRYSQTPKTDENPYLWAQSQEVGDVKNIIEQIKLSHLTHAQNIKLAEVKLFGATGSEENPSPLSIWHGYAQIPETAAWQIERKMISNPNELDLARTSHLVKVINTYRRLIKESNELLNTFPKSMEEVTKFFPEEAARLFAIHKIDTEHASYLRERETHFKRLLIDIKKNIAENIYPEKVAEPIRDLLKQLDAPISEITVEMPRVFQEKSFDDVRNALRPANDNEVTRNDKPNKNIAA
jgi:hypothetical protein